MTSCFCRSLKELASWVSFDGGTWGFSSSLVIDLALGSMPSTCFVCAASSLPLLFMDVRSDTIPLDCSRSASFEGRAVGIEPVPGTCGT